MKRSWIVALVIGLSAFVIAADESWLNLLCMANDTVYGNAQKRGKVETAIAQIKYNLGDATPSADQLAYVASMWRHNWRMKANTNVTAHIWQDSMPNVWGWDKYRKATSNEIESVRVKIKGAGDGPHFEAQLVPMWTDEKQLGDWGCERKPASIEP